MERDMLWRAFRETGAPVFYLMYRQIACNDGKYLTNEKGTGEVPVPR